MRLRYLRWGDSSQRRRVLLLHGLGDAAGVLAGLARSLAARGFCVYALDLRGHGDSTRAADADYSAAAVAEDVESFVLELARRRLFARLHCTFSRPDAQPCDRTCTPRRSRSSASASAPPRRRASRPRGLRSSQLSRSASSG